MKSEIFRIKEVYRLRKKRGIQWSIFRPEVHFMYFELQRKYIEAFKLCGVNEKNISEKKILDAGCGDGKFLRWLQDLGFRFLFGIDIQKLEIISAQRINPNIKFISGDISSLPFKSNYFDFVISSEVFSSIFNNKMLSESAKEIFRVLAPGGAVIFNDSSRFLKRPKLEGKDYLRSINKNDLIKLFPQAKIKSSYFLVDPFFTGIFTSIINRGILNSILRKIPFIRKITDKNRVLMLKFPYCFVEIIKHLGFVNTHIFSIIKKLK